MAIKGGPQQDEAIGRKTVYVKGHKFVASRVEPGWCCIGCGRVWLGDLPDPVFFGWCG